MTTISTINNNNVNITQLAHPVGFNLANSGTRSISPLPGLIAYNTTDSSHYVGTNSSDWQKLSSGSAGDVTLAPIGNSPNANGASLSGQILNLQPANESFGGVVLTSAQSFAGKKTFNSGIGLGVGYPGTLDTYSKSTVSTNWTGAAGTASHDLVYERIGNIVFVTFPNVYIDKAVGGAGTIDISGTIPAQYIPAASTTQYISIYDAVGTNVSTDGEFSQGVMYVASSTGYITIGLRPTTTSVTPITAFAGSGGSGQYNGVMNQTVMYRIV